jgi:hypothetical protein
MKVYVIGKWYGKENYELFLLIQSLFEQMGYQVIKQQDKICGKKGKEVVEVENKLIKAADVVVRIYRGDAQSDEAAYEGTVATMKHNKPLVTLIVPGYSEEDLPSCLLTYSKKIVKLREVSKKELEKVRLESVVGVRPS